MKNDTEFDNGLPKKATTGSAIQTNGNTPKVANGSQVNLFFWIQLQWQ
jgi:hypothetical protein